MPPPACSSSRAYLFLTAGQARYCDTILNDMYDFEKSQIIFLVNYTNSNTLHDVRYHDIDILLMSLPGLCWNHANGKEFDQLFSTRMPQEHVSLYLFNMCLWHLRIRVVSSPPPLTLCSLHDPEDARLSRSLVCSD
jgi:hypothetical protein